MAAQDFKLRIHFRFGDLAHYILRIGPLRRDHHVSTCILHQKFHLGDILPGHQDGRREGHEHNHPRGAQKEPPLAKEGFRCAAQRQAGRPVLEYVAAPNNSRLHNIEFNLPIALCQSKAFRPSFGGGQTRTAIGGRLRPA